MPSLHNGPRTAGNKSALSYRAGIAVSGYRCVVSMQCTPSLLSLQAPGGGPSTCRSLTLKWDNQN